MTSLPSRILATGLLLVVGMVRAEEMPTPARPERTERLTVLARTGADRWHQIGERGRGVTVAILDGGFRGWKHQLGRHLPATTQAHTFRADGQLEARNSQHGILCGEVVHAMAPEARLLLVGWEPDQPTSFLQAVAWARQQGARVLCCSLIMPCWSDGEGGGPIHARLRRLLQGADGQPEALFVACAGNTAQHHWAGFCTPDAQGWHQWRPGVTSNRLTPWIGEPGEMLSVELCWADTRADYELDVRDAAGKRVGGSRRLDDAHPGSKVVRFAQEPGCAYTIRVRQVVGQPGRFHLVALSGPLAHHTPDGSVPFPGDGDQVLAVGAASAQGERLHYSAYGRCADVLKPDLMAVVPFPSAVRQRAFSGTSAAAPQAAGLAALIWARHTDWTPDDVREALASSAVEQGRKGKDPETGYGLLRLPAPPATPGDVIQTMLP